MRLKQFTLAALAVSAAAATFSGSAFATKLNFDQNNDFNRTGTLSYDGTDGLIGDTISFAGFQLDGNGGQEFTCDNRCRLNFNTGDNISVPTNNVDNGVYSFAGGGSFVLEGSVVTGDGTPVASGTLLNGQFVGNQTGISSNGDSFSFNGNGNTTVSADLLDFLGIDSDTSFRYLNTEFSLGNVQLSDSDGTFSGDVTNADLAVEDVATDVPAPSQIALFGIGLLLVGGGIGANRRRRS